MPAVRACVRRRNQSSIIPPAASGKKNSLEILALPTIPSATRRATMSLITQPLAVVLVSATLTNAFVANHGWSPNARRSNTETVPQQLISDARGYKETVHGIAIFQRRKVLLAGIHSDGEQENSGDRESNDKMLDELVRVKLEKDHKRSFLKSRPWKLPYEDARRWVQANLGADTQEDFFDLVENGNLRTPYIPKNPEDYYSTTNDWISWDHFLHGLFDTNSDREPPSGVKPMTGIFD